MIKVTKLNGKEYYINAEIVVTIEETPDTIITTSLGNKIIVKESSKEIVEKIIEYKRTIFKEILNIPNKNM
jgi:flagellar protein FlbD